ncbi:hypothetical protein MRX96_027422 [Rhipicephalus microplus]
MLRSWQCGRKRPRTSYCLNEQFFYCAGTTFLVILLSLIECVQMDTRLRPCGVIFCRPVGALSCAPKSTRQLSKKQCIAFLRLRRPLVTPFIAFPFVDHVAPLIVLSSSGLEVTARLPRQRTRIGLASSNLVETCSSDMSAFLWRTRLSSTALLFIRRASANLSASSCLLNCFLAAPSGAQAAT